MNLVIPHPRHSFRLLTAILINAARGDFVDESALVNALDSGCMAGAGPDVDEEEPHVTPGLPELENVILLPRSGTVELEVRTEMGLMTVANQESFFADRDVPNRVN